MKEESSRENGIQESQSKLSRRDFLKYSAGVAAVTAGVTVVLGKLPLPSAEKGKAAPARSSSSGPIVVSVDGDELTVMSGHNEVKVKDAALASAIASKAQ